MGSDKAPDFSFLDKNKVTKKLSELTGAETYIIVFWSSTCSHCLDKIPKLRKFLKTHTKEKIKVMAIALEDEPNSWEVLKKKYPEFIHVYGKGKWDNEIGNNYGVTATPTYFVLDKDKKIVNKPEDFDDLKKFFEK